MDIFCPAQPAVPGRRRGNQPGEAENPGDRWEFIRSACALVKDKVKTLAEVPMEIDFIFKPGSALEYQAKDLIGKNDRPAAAAQVLEETINLPAGNFGRNL